MKRHIPNTITCCNLISGCIATYFAFRGDYSFALLFIVIGAVFDFFDGMSARLLGVSSPIGLELDSLADDVTFGVAPSAMLFGLLSDGAACNFPAADAAAACVGCSAVSSGCSADCLVGRLVPFLAFLVAAFSALRLAKFNLDERQTTSFIGLPTPANAIFWGALVAGGGSVVVATPLLYYMLIVMIPFSCFLLVSEIPMFSLKVKHLTWKGNRTRIVFLAVCIPLLFLGVIGLAACIAWYVLLSLIVSRTRAE